MTSTEQINYFVKELFSGQDYFNLRQLKRSKFLECPSATTLKCSYFLHSETKNLFKNKKCSYKNEYSS